MSVDISYVDVSEGTDEEPYVSWIKSEIIDSSMTDKGILAARWDQETDYLLIVWDREEALVSGDKTILDGIVSDSLGKSSSDLEKDACDSSSLGDSATDDTWVSKCSREIGPVTGGCFFIGWYVNLNLDSTTGKYEARVRNSTTSEDIVVTIKEPSNADSDIKESWSGMIPVTLSAGKTTIVLDFRSQDSSDEAIASDAYLYIIKG